VDFFQGWADDVDFKNKTITIEEAVDEYVMSMYRGTPLLTPSHRLVHHRVWHLPQIGMRGTLGSREKRRGRRRWKRDECLI
jgi:hypothetical protein